MTAADHRHAPRADITLWVEEHRPEGVIFHHTGNISVSGVYFDGALPHPLGTRVRLRFTLLDSGHVVDTEGEVVRSLLEEDRPGMAVRFTALSASDAQAISRLVSATDDSR